MRNYDIVFLKHFSQIIAVLVSITILLILLGMYLNGFRVDPPGKAAQKATHERIQPAGDVFAGSTGAAAQAAAVAAAAEAAKGDPALNFGGTLDGSVVFGKVCTACHSTGALGAPKLEKAAWAARIAQGKDTLYAHAMNGYKSMPARGNNTALTDGQIKVTVDWMISQLK